MHHGVGESSRTTAGNSVILCVRVRHAFQFRDSIVVSISACHAEDPGSIPGRGMFASSQLMGVHASVDICPRHWCHAAAPGKHRSGVVQGVVVLAQAKTSKALSSRALPK